MNKGIKIIGTILIVAFLLVPTIAYVQNDKSLLEQFREMILELKELKDSLEELKKERAAIQEQLDKLEKPTTPPSDQPTPVKPPTTKPPIFIPPSILPPSKPPADPDKLTPDEIRQILPPKMEDELRKEGRLRNEPLDLDHEEKPKVQPPPPTKPKTFEESLSKYEEVIDAEGKKLPGFFHAEVGNFEGRKLKYITRAALIKISKANPGKFIRVKITEPSYCPLCRSSYNEGDKYYFMTAAQIQHWLKIRIATVPTIINFKFENGELKYYKP